MLLQRTSMVMLFSARGLHRRGAGLAVAMLLAVASTRGLAQDSSRPGPSFRLSGADVVLRHPERTRLRWTCSLYGRLEADETRTRIVSVPVAGKVARVVAVDGAKVAQSDLLFEIESDELVALTRYWNTGVLALHTALSEAANLSRRPAATQTASRRGATEIDLAQISVAQRIDDARRELEKIRARTALVASRAGQPIDANVMDRIKSGRIGVLASATGQVFMPGIVEGRSVDDRGAAPGRIVDTSTLVAELALPERLIEYVSRGLQIKAAFDEIPTQDFDGTIVSVGSMVNLETSTVLLRVEFANANDLLKLGMHANATIRFVAKQPTLTIPSAALVSAVAGTSVWKQRPGGDYELQRVWIGARRSGLVEIVAGLSEADFVALPRREPMVSDLADPAGERRTDCKDALTSSTME